MWAIRDDIFSHGSKDLPTATRRTVWWLIDEKYEAHMQKCVEKRAVEMCATCSGALYPTATVGNYERDYLHSRAEAELICDQLNIRDYGRIADVDSASAQ